MDRRRFIQAATLTAAALAASRSAFAQQAAAPAPAGATPAAAHLPFAPTPDAGWRTYELTSRIELAGGAGTSRVWLPLPSVEAPAWQRLLGNLWNGNAREMRIVSNAEYGAQMLYAEWAEGEPAPVLEVVSRFATRDRAVDLSQPGQPQQLDRATRRLYTKPTELLPIDGIVRKTALEIIKGKQSDLDKARAIFDWVVLNTARNPKTRGCGIGDIKTMLETGDLSGKCADLNALYVGLARAAGLPARDVYGVRVGASRFNYKSLGKAGDVSKAQHCRAEVFLAGFGWVAVDPADVRKVLLEETAGLTLESELVQAVRGRLFGGWEGNWLGYNFAHDLALPGSKGPKVPFLMYPQGETAAGRLDSLDPAAFKYTLSARELARA